MSPTFDSLDWKAFDYLDPTDPLVAPHTMNHWPQYNSGNLDEDDLDHVPSSTAVEYTSGVYQVQGPATAGNLFPWKTSTTDPVPYTTSYAIPSNSLSGASMQYSLSGSSSQASQPYAAQQVSTPDYSSPEYISQRFNALLQEKTPGTPEYQTILSAYTEWYEQFKATQVSQNADAKTETSNDDDDDDLEEDSDATVKIKTRAGIAWSKVLIGIDPKTGKQKRYFPCPYVPCTSQPSRKADLTRHINSMHLTDDDKKLVDCPELDCVRVGKRGFTRTDHLVEHLRNFHHRAEDYPKKGRKDDSKGEDKRRRKGAGSGL